MRDSINPFEAAPCDQCVLRDRLIRALVEVSQELLALTWCPASGDSDEDPFGDDGAEPESSSWVIDFAMGHDLGELRLARRQSGDDKEEHPNAE